MPPVSTSSGSASVRDTMPTVRSARRHATSRGDDEEDTATSPSLPPLPPVVAAAPEPSGRTSGVTPSSFRLPEGAGCTADIARWQAIQDNDLNSGHVNPKVYEQIQGDIKQASSACAAPWTKPKRTRASSRCST